MAMVLIYSGVRSLQGAEQRRKKGGVKRRACFCSNMAISFVDVLERAKKHSVCLAAISGGGLLSAPSGVRF